MATHGFSASQQQHTQSFEQSSAQATMMTMTGTNNNDGTENSSNAVNFHTAASGHVGSTAAAADQEARQKPAKPLTGGPTATAPFLQDFSLVAEAAKRAQMAVVTRDLEGVSL
jgi:hypothetical protein